MQYGQLILATAWLLVACSSK